MMISKVFMEFFLAKLDISPQSSVVEVVGEFEKHLVKSLISELNNLLFLRSVMVEPDGIYVHFGFVFSLFCEQISDGEGGNSGEAFLWVHGNFS